MKKQGLLLVAALLAGCGTLAARSWQPQVRIDSPSYQRQNDEIVVGMVVDFTDLEITNNEMLVLTPLVAGPTDTVAMAPIRIAGHNRYEIGEYYKIDSDPYLVALERRNWRNRYPKGTQIVDYLNATPWKSWMDGCFVMIRQEIIGCAGQTVELEPIVLGQLLTPIEPELTIIIPEQTVKERQERISIRVHFPVGSSKLSRSFSNNAHELARIDSLTLGIMNDRKAQIEQIVITGYGSPEGAYSFNQRLAANRAQSVRNFLVEKYPSINRTLIVTESVPEDWDSLRRWAVHSDWAYAKQLVNIIDEVSNPDARDARIRALDGGVTYRNLLRDVYPQLRRVDYLIDYKLPQYSPAQSALIIREHPDQLSVYEFWTVAQKYEPGTPESDEVWAIAARYYPDDVYVNNNQALSALLRHDYAGARRNLERVARKDRRVLNNLGVILLMQGDEQAAMNAFRQAAAAGSREARHNLDNLEGIILYQQMQNGGQPATDMQMPSHERRKQWTPEQRREYRAVRRLDRTERRIDGRTATGARRMREHRAM